MKVVVTARHYELEDAVRTHAIERVNKIEKFGHALQDAHVVLEAEKYRQIAEISVQGKQSRYTGRAESTDMRQSIDSACDKVETQIKKHADRAKDHKGEPKNAE